MIQRLTLTPATQYGSLSEKEKAFMEQSHEKAAVISGMARGIYPADDIEGVDLDPAPGKIHVQASKDSMMMEQKMTLKDPDRKEFDFKNIESFKLVAVDLPSDGFTSMSIKSDVMLDVDGDGKEEKGTLCTMQEGSAGRISGKPEVHNNFNVFINDGGQSVTIIEETPSRIWTPDSAF